MWDELQKSVYISDFGLKGGKTPYKNDTVDSSSGQLIIKKDNFLNHQQIWQNQLCLPQRLAVSSEHV